MALTLEEMKELEKLKLDNKQKELEYREAFEKAEHDRKVERLNLRLEIAKAGGTQESD